MKIPHYFHLAAPILQPPCQLTEACSLKSGGFLAGPDVLLWSKGDDFRDEPEHLYEICTKGDVTLGAEFCPEQMLVARRPVNGLG